MQTNNSNVSETTSY